MDTENPMQAGKALRQQLAQGDVALAGLAPVLTHLLATPGQALVSEDVLARMRGMLRDLARQLLATLAEVSDKPDHNTSTKVQSLAGMLAGSSILVSHIYAAAIESQLAERLEQSSTIDPVLTPLLQELIASSDEKTAELAMATMSAQARFVQAQRRMHLPLIELPSELFLDVLSRWRTSTAESHSDSVANAEKKLRDNFDESASRLGLLSRLVGSLSGGVRAALDLEHAGVALFATALSRCSRQPRELVVLSCHERQLARFALGLRAAGLDREDIARQFLLIHRDHSPPTRINEISPDEALDLLSGTAAERRR